MCGIAGFLQSHIDKEQLEKILSCMGESLKHRGPDDEGQWTDEELGVGLLHRRLEIVGIGSQGHQPMSSSSGRYIISFNGEIYNFRELRRQLKTFGHVFYGESDTEVLLHGIEFWGLEKTLELSAGMFALALYDVEEQTLTLARDRLGEKPLYMGWQGECFIFASELGAIRQHPSWDADIDRSGLADLVRYNYIPEPRSIFSGIKKVKPGCLHRFRRKGGSWSETEARSWWSIKKIVHDNKISLPIDYLKIVDNLDKLLRNVISDQGSADVAVGSFLSGGIDSTLVTAILQDLSNQPIKTFSVGFDNQDFDETEFAANVSTKLGTDHTEIKLSADDVLELIPEIPKYYDEPFADSSQIPTTAVCRLAAKTVKVALSGDAGDELFGGYNRYLWGPRINSIRQRFPTALLALTSGMLLHIKPAYWDILQANFIRLARYPNPIPQLGEKLHKVGSVLSCPTEKAIYRRLVESWSDSAIVLEGTAQDLLDQNDLLWQLGGSFQEKMMLQDLVSYLPGDILVKVDRAAMRFGLETRIPFLDHRVVEFAYNLPMEAKYEKRFGKKVLRSLLAQYLPEYDFRRPKTGFSIPIHEWLRGPLYTWADSLLSEDRLKEGKFFNAEKVRSVWKEHLSAKRNNHVALWSVLMFQAWCDTQNDK